MTLGIFIGLLYAFVGMRVLMALDDSGRNPCMRWAAESELKTWIVLIAWPVILCITALLWGLGKLLTRRIRKEWTR